ncbi:MAG: hypothetical protein GF308_01115 [Candidatus Heimdallarchaeota archaeon]|nr:hypothetical protein [Candidatus Heimdallarchaeota archaeon]
MTLEEESSPKNQDEEGKEKEEEETYLSYYLKQKRNWFSLLIGLFILLNLLALFLTTNYLLDAIFLYLGILMIIVAGASLFFIAWAENYLWALLASLIYGIMPIIELSIHLATVQVKGASLVFGILSMIIAVGFVFLPFILIFEYQRRKTKKKEQATS